MVSGGVLVLAFTALLTFGHGGLATGGGAVSNVNGGRNNKFRLDSELVTRFFAVLLLARCSVKLFLFDCILIFILTVVDGRAVEGRGRALMVASRTEV